MSPAALSECSSPSSRKSNIYSSFTANSPWFLHFSSQSPVKVCLVQEVFLEIIADLVYKDILCPTQILLSSWYRIPFPGSFLHLNPVLWRSWTSWFLSPTARVFRYPVFNVEILHPPEILGREAFDSRKLLLQILCKVLNYRLVPSRAFPVFNNPFPDIPVKVKKALCDWLSVQSVGFPYPFVLSR